MTPCPSSKRRLTARERLLEHLDDCAGFHIPILAWEKKQHAKTRRLLAAVLREERGEVLTAVQRVFDRMEYGDEGYDSVAGSDLVDGVIAVLRSGRGKR